MFRILISWFLNSSQPWLYCHKLISCYLHFSKIIFLNLFRLLCIFNSFCRYINLIQNITLLFVHLAVLISSTNLRLFFILFFLRCSPFNFPNYNSFIVSSHTYHVVIFSKLYFSHERGMAVILFMDLFRNICWIFEQSDFLISVANSNELSVFVSTYCLNIWIINSLEYSSNRKSDLSCLSTPLSVFTRWSTYHI